MQNILTKNPLDKEAQDHVEGRKKEQPQDNKKMKDKTINVLDHGFIRVIDTMGDDSAIVQAARVSYGDGTKSVREDRGLIRYLLSHAHTSPFEMCEIKLHVKLPIFVARQWIRHRTANVNEYSGRYSEMRSEFYVPETENVLPQSLTNKQGRDGEMPINAKYSFINDVLISSDRAFQNYREHIDPEGINVARELARINLPLNTYTEMYWKIDLHNLLHFLKLRDDSHAQYEIQAYAQALSSLVQEWVPMAHEAYVDYIKESYRLSRMEVKLVTDLLRVAAEKYDIKQIEELMDLDGFSPREIAAFKAKFF